VATLAAQFARFGIEPRHLRPGTRTPPTGRPVRGADRASPWSGKRNPEARVRAHEQVEELALLRSAAFAGALLRGALKTLLDS